MMGGPVGFESSVRVPSLQRYPLSESSVLIEEFSCSLDIFPNIIGALSQVHIPISIIGDYYRIQPLHG